MSVGSGLDERLMIFQQFYDRSREAVDLLHDANLIVVEYLVTDYNKEPSNKMSSVQEDAHHGAR